MNELALHVLDIAQNSVRAGATWIKISIIEALSDNLLTISIEDNGKGIEDTLLKNITNPFVTTRKLRKVGLGLPFVAQICEECAGEFCIKSQVGEGTFVTATMQHDHIDRLPLGNMAETMITLIMAKPTIQFVYHYQNNDAIFEMDTDEIQQLLEDVPINDLAILEWLKKYIEDGEDKTK